MNYEIFYTIFLIPLNQFIKLLQKQTFQSIYIAANKYIKPEYLFTYIHFIMGCKPILSISSQHREQNYLLQRLKTKYHRYILDTDQQQIYNDLNSLEYLVRNILNNVINEKLMLLNQNKISTKQCKIQIAKTILQIELFILKFIEERHPDQIKEFLQTTDKFLIRLAQYLKTVYPRGQNIEAGQLAKKFKEFDFTEQYEYDILKNAGVCFTSINEFDITNKIKLFINTIITELDTKFSAFYQLIYNINPNFKIGRKISENTSKYFTLNTGTVQINSIQVARVLVKWMTDLSQSLMECQDKITAKQDYKFYKEYPQKDKIQFSKCESASFIKILNNSFIMDLKSESKRFQQKQQIRTATAKRFQVSLIKMLNQAKHNQSEISRQAMEVIKFSANNISFIQWMVEEELVQAIKGFVQISRDHSEFRGTLDVIKFKINDLMRCQILGKRIQLIEIFQKFQTLQKQGKLEIIKIKNRFQTAMSDTMIFFKMPDSFIICECQLILAEQSKSQELKASKNIENINHFLYQLQRSPFGVLGQISVFLASKSQTVSQYSDKITLTLNNQKQITYCQKHHKQVSAQTLQQAKQQRTPFLCSKCFKFYPKYSNKNRIYKCSRCNIHLCNRCMNKNFEIKNNYIISSLDKKIADSKDQFKKSKIYKRNKDAFDESLQFVNGQYLMDNVFIGEKMIKLPHIKDKWKKDRVKAEFIIKYILETPNFERLYIQTDLRFNFIVITWGGGQIRFKCYRYDHLQNIIINSFQQLERYESYEEFEIKQYDIFYQVKPQGSCNYIQKNKLTGDYKARQILEKGIYIFEGQQKRKMLKHFDQVQDKFRDQFLLINFQIKPIKQSKQKHKATDIVFKKNITPGHFEMYLIVDSAKSLKRSQNKEKIQLYLDQLSKLNQFKKHIQLNNMNIENQHLNSIDSNLKWMQNIKILSLSNNRISNISKILSFCKKIQKLQITNNHFQKLVFNTQLQSLVEVDASQNKISQIDGIMNIFNIEVLNLQSNALNKRFIIKSLFGPIKFQKLRQMNLSFNQIDSLQPFAGSYQPFPHLTYLNVKQNRLVKIPKLNLQKLQEINLSSNLIQDLSDFADANCPVLVKLYLKYNKLTHIPKLKFENLGLVDISYNKLQNINDFSKGDYFENLSQFYVSLSSPEKLPKLNENIKIFSFQNSGITDKDLNKLLADNQFKKLRELYLTNNQITTLPNICNLGSLRLLCLEQNPICNLESCKSKKNIPVQNPQNKQNKKNQKSQKNQKNQQLRCYSNLDRLWLSLKVNGQSEFKKKYLQLIRHLQPFETVTNIALVSVISPNIQNRIICWQYQQNDFSIPMSKIQKLITSIHESKTHNLICKRQYLLNVFQSEQLINQRYKKQQNTSFYQLHHHWVLIDMNQFVRSDWRNLAYLDLRGAALNDKKWEQFVQKAEFFPNLREIHLWDNSIQNLEKGCLEKFKSISYIDFYKIGWQYRLSEASKQYLKEFKEANPQKFINF